MTADLVTFAEEILNGISFRKLVFRKCKTGQKMKLVFCPVSHFLKTNS